MAQNGSTPTPQNGSAPATEITLYWRPGCGFCSGLQRGLDKLGIERVERNIWDDPNDAAVVRHHANGNETVPTVVVGGQGFVNPSANQLAAWLAENEPHLLPADFEPPQPGGVGRSVQRVLGG
ncbi:MAG: NrdH-redoxin [Ilumatobacteraceae bacterium]|nr:NrdH-redoxin [Ilumatobacteraceae bacterium]